MDPFVGRRTELAALRARLGDARQGRPWVVAVQGPAGIGKTALLEQFLAEAEGTGASPRSASEERTAPGSRPFHAEARAARNPRSCGGAARRPRACSTTGCWPAGAVRGSGGRGAAGGGRATVGAGADPRRDLPARAARRARDRRPRRAGRRRPALGGPAVGARPGVRAAPTGGRPGAGRAGDARRRRHGAAGEPAPGRVGPPRRHRAARRSGRGRPARAGRPPRDRGTARPCRTAAAGRHAGNPLHVRAVLDEAAGFDKVPDGWRDDRQPLPSPRSFRLLVGDRYATCVDDTRRLVDAAAVLGVRSPLPLAASVGEVGEPVQAVDEAVARGLLVAETAAHPWGWPSRTRWCAPRSTTPSGRLGAGPCTSPRPSSSRARSRYCTIGSPRRRRRTAPSPTTSRRSPAGRPPQQWQSATRHLVESARLCPDREEGRRGCSSR